MAGTPDSFLVQFVRHSYDVDSTRDIPDPLATQRLALEKRTQREVVTPDVFDRTLSEPSLLDRGDHRITYSAFPLLL